MTPCTRSSVLAATPYRPLITLETVATDTPAAEATSWIVTRRAHAHERNHIVYKTLSITIDIQALMAAKVRPDQPIPILAHPEPARSPAARPAVDPPGADPLVHLNEEDTSHEG